jgi:hypothetical protein
VTAPLAALIVKPTGRLTARHRYGGSPPVASGVNVPTLALITIVCG